MNIAMKIYSKILNASTIKSFNMLEATSTTTISSVIYGFKHK